MSSCLNECTHLNHPLQCVFSLSSHQLFSLTTKHESNPPNRLPHNIMRNL
jgi:hypothetical protein